MGILVGKPHCAPDSHTCLIQREREPYYHKAILPRFSIPGGERSEKRLCQVFSGVLQRETDLQVMSISQLSASASRGLMQFKLSHQRRQLVLGEQD